MAYQAGICPGCGANFPEMTGPVHDYMTSSPACWHNFGRLLAVEYSDAALMDIHRLSVDTYAVQHPGYGASRRAIQSIGLHLARLFVQLESPRSPKETNDVMLGFSGRKASLVALSSPAGFSKTLADVVDHVGTDSHRQCVKEWAACTWADFHEHHDYIRDWVGGSIDI